MAKKSAVIFGVLFLLAGVLGFIPNPLIGHEKFFHTNPAHNVLYLISSAALLYAAAKGEAGAAWGLKIVAGLYLVVAVLGFLAGTEKPLLGLIAANAADNWLHLMLAIILFAAGIASKDINAPLPPPAQPLIQN